MPPTIIGPCLTPAIQNNALASTAVTPSDTEPYQIRSIASEVPPHPALLPKGRRNAFPKVAAHSLSPWGEGWGEGVYNPLEAKQ